MIDQYHGQTPHTLANMRINILWAFTTVVSFELSHIGMVYGPKISRQTPSKCIQITFLSTVYWERTNKKIIGEWNPLAKKGDFQKDHT